MKDLQKIIKYCAIGFAILLTVGIIGSLLNLAGWLAGASFSSGVLEESRIYTVSGEIHRLELEISAAEIFIREGETLMVESNLKKLKVEEEGGVLTIRDPKKNLWGVSHNGATLTLYLPADAVLEEAELTTGAGRFSAERLTAQRIDLELGAGEVVIEELNALQEADIKGGAGKITLEGGQIRNLELELGVGQAMVTAALSGEGDIDCGVGKLDLTLLGKKEDYSLSIEKGIGEIRVSGQILKSNSTIGGGATRLRVSGGIGALEVDYGENT